MWNLLSLGLNQELCWSDEWKILIYYPCFNLTMHKQIKPDIANLSEGFEDDCKG